MTLAISPHFAAGPRFIARRRTWALCLMLVISVGAGGSLVPVFSDPQGAVRGKIDPISDSDLSALRGVAAFHLHSANAAETDRAVRCLTDAIYYEAADEPVQGQRAIAQVVINRLRDRHFPKSVCGVVYEGWERRTGCQFSFVCDGSIVRRRAAPVLWERLRPLAEAALNGHVESEVGTATHYHATYVHPSWIRSVAEIAAVGKHIFYKWKGRAGMPSALRGVYAGGEFQIAQSVLDGSPPLHLSQHGEAKSERGVALIRMGRRRTAAFRLASVRITRSRWHGGRTAHGSIRLT